MIEQLAVNVLATERVTRLVVEDEITRELRYWVQSKWPTSKVSYLVTCPYCVSVWAGLAVSVVRRRPIGRALLYGLALSQATIHVKELKDG